jgi:hypothetical protein
MKVFCYELHGGNRMTKRVTSFIRINLFEQNHIQRLISLMHIVQYWMGSDGRCRQAGRQADSCTENVLAELYRINYDT